MSHANRVQKQRARRGRRKRRRPQMRLMAAYTPRCRSEKWITRTAWTRKHPVRRKFSWNGALKAPAKKLKNIVWWEDREDE
jgi:hypothetical protein